MNDIQKDELDLKPKLDQPRAIETSDNTASLTQDSSPPVLALQEEVIRLRKEGRPDAVKFPKKGDTGSSTQDTLSGEVQDYSPQIASLATPIKLSKTDSAPPADMQTPILGATPDITASAEAEKQLAAAFSAKTGPIRLSLQPRIIEPTIKNDVSTETTTRPAPSTEPADNSTQFAAVGASDVKPRAQNGPTFDTFIATSEFANNQPTRTIALTTPSKVFEKPPETAKSFESPSILPSTQPNILVDKPPEKPPARSFGTDIAMSNTAKPNTEAPVIAQNPPITPALSAPLPVQDSPARNFVANNTQDKTIAFNPSATNQNSAQAASNPTERSNQNIARSFTESPIPSSTDKPQKSEQIAFSPSQPSPAQSPTPSETSRSNVNQETGAPARQNQFLQPQQSNDRPNIIASSAASDYGSVLRELPKDISKEKEKEWQVANAFNYPKYGGAAPVEESAKPVIPQAKPQSFQSSLARDAAPEKAHPLSESFVSGKVLSQPGKDNSPKDAANDPKQDVKATDAKSIDAKSTETKAGETKFSTARADSKSPDSKSEGSKSPDSKHVEAKFTEGRAADPRTIDSSHSAIGPVRHSTEQAGANLPSAERIVAAAQPGKPTDSQVPQKADGTTKPDWTTKSDGTIKSDGTQTDASDKSGKKPDTDDKKDIQGKGPGNAADTGKIPGSKAFNDLLDFIDKATDGDIKPGGKVNTPLIGQNILIPDDVLITGTGAIGQGLSGMITDDSKDDTADDDKLSHRRKKYIVQAGDTLDSIAKSQLGDARFANLILTINQANISSKIENGKKIAIKLQPGQILWLPSDHELQVHAEIYLLNE